MHNEIPTLTLSVGDYNDLSKDPATRVSLAIVNAIGRNAVESARSQPTPYALNFIINDDKTRSAFERDFEKIAIEGIIIKDNHPTHSNECTIITFMDGYANNYTQFLDSILEKAAGGLLTLEQYNAFSPDDPTRRVALTLLHIMGKEKMIQMRDYGTIDGAYDCFFEKALADDLALGKPFLGEFYKETKFVYWTQNREKENISFPENKHSNKKKFAELCEICGIRDQKAQEDTHNTTLGLSTEAGKFIANAKRPPKPDTITNHPIDKLLKDAESETYAEILSTSLFNAGKRTFVETWKQFKFSPASSVRLEELKNATKALIILLQDDQAHIQKKIEENDSSYPKDDASAVIAWIDALLTELELGKLDALHRQSLAEPRTRRGKS